MTSTDRIRFIQKTSADGHYWTSPAPAAALRAHLQDCASTFFKEASLGGDQEQSFEQAFSSLAYSYLKDKAPRLIDYIIGFQLVDRNEDSTKAVGVFGFKVGDQWLYAPVFFLNGDLKGHELLYVKKQDAFVPMKENWVNYLISRKPHLLGEGSPKDSFQLGGIPPDIYRLTHPPTSAKYGADAPYRPRVQDWASSFLAFAAAAAVKSPALFHKQAALGDTLDLGHFLREDFSLLRGAFELSRRYPLLKAGFDRFYGRDFFARLAEELRQDAQSLLKRGAYQGGRGQTARKKKRRKRGEDSLIEAAPLPVHPIKSGALRIIVHDTITAISGDPSALARAPLESLLGDDKTEEVRRALDKKSAAAVDEEAPGGITRHKDEPTQKDQERLLRDGVVIRDRREDHEKSVVYNVQVRLELINPNETGLYRVLEKPGQFDEMLVLLHPFTNRGRQQWTTVVRLESPRDWLNSHSSNLWVQASPEPGRPDFKAWFDKLDGTGHDALKKGGVYLAVGPTGEATTPFRVRQSYGDGVYQVDFKDDVRYGQDRPTWLSHRVPSDDYLGSGEYVSTYDARLFFTEREGTSLRSSNGELSVPANFKVFKLSDPPPPLKKNDPDSLIGCCEPEVDSAGSTKKPIQPGNLIDIQLLIHEKTAAVKILDAGSEVWIKAKGVEERMAKKAALIALVRDHGCTEDAARDMLKDAAVHGHAVFRIKYADSFAGPNSNSMLAGGPGAPAMPPALTGAERVGYNSFPASYPQEQFQMIPEMSASRTDPTIYDPFYQPDQRAMQTAQEASQSGQKEIFDTATIGSMLKAVRQDSIVDRYLGDLMKALDRLGRVLFMFYWHQEEFEDRYGKQDLPELEDSLRNAFETLGDVTLFLKEKQVGGGMDEINNMSGQGKGEPDIDEAARN